MKQDNETLEKKKKIFLERVTNALEKEEAFILFTSESGTSLQVNHNEPAEKRIQHILSAILRGLLFLEETTGMDAELILQSESILLKEYKKNNVKKKGLTQ